MNFIKKYWIILVSLAITAIIALILYRWFNESFVSIIVAIPSLFLSLFINSSREQEKLARMQIAEKKKEQEEKEEQEKFDKMFQFVLNFFISVNCNCEFNGIIYESGKNISSKVASHPSYIVLDKIFNLKLSPNMFLYALFLTVKHNTVILTSSDQDVIDKFNTIDKCYIKILKRELPKILTPDVFDGEKLIVKDE